MYLRACQAIVYGEADLDIELAQPSKHTQPIFFAPPANDMFSEPVVYPQNVTVFAADDPYWGNQATIRGQTIGLFNTFLDALDGSYCTYCAYGECGDASMDPKYPDHRKNGYTGKLQCGWCSTRLTEKWHVLLT